MSAHATLSPSGAAGWMRCAPKLAMEFGIIDHGSEFADEGTAAHFLASECLTLGITPDSYAGRPIIVWSDIPSHTRGTDWEDGMLPIPLSATQRTFEVDDEMTENVQIYLDAITSRMEQFKLRGAINVDLLVEVKVEFSVFVGFPDQFGTSDVVLLVEWADGTMQIDVNDLKYGKGVRVYAADEGAQLPAGGNEQMMIYGLGAYDQFAALGNYTSISWCIHQPRLGHISEAECSAQALLEWATTILKPAAEQAMMYFESRDVVFSPSDFNPGEKQCMWCKAKGSCKAAAQYVFDSISGDFINLDAEVQPQIAEVVTRLGHLTNAQVGEAMALTDFIEGWCKAVRAKAEGEMLSGHDVPGWKLVQGRQGNRVWPDVKAAEAALKSFRLKQEQMYNLKLISPTDAEKLLEKESPKRWAKLQKLIGRSPGKPSVAPVNDKREAISLAPSADDFTDLQDASDLI